MISNCISISFVVYKTRPEINIRTKKTLFVFISAEIDKTDPTEDEVIEEELRKANERLEDVSKNETSIFSSLKKTKKLSKFCREKEFTF